MSMVKQQTLFSFMVVGGDTKPNTLGTNSISPTPIVVP